MPYQEGVNLEPVGGGKKKAVRPTPGIYSDPSGMFGGEGGNYAPAPGGLPPYRSTPVPSTPPITPLTITAQRDPKLDETYGDFRDFRGELAAGTDRDAVNAMMRGRDSISGLAKEIGQERALATGGSASGAANQAVTDVYTSGGRDLARTNADLAASGRSAQLAALSGQSGVAQAGNAALMAANRFALDTWQSQRDQAMRQAELEAARQRTAWEQQLALADMDYTG